MSPERRLRDVAKVHAHLMVARPKIQLSEEASTMQFIQEFFDHWNWEFVLDGYCVEGPVVDAEPPRTIGLLDQQDK
jgi:hypothetical protein